MATLKARAPNTWFIKQKSAMGAISVLRPMSVVPAMQPPSPKAAIHMVGAQRQFSLFNCNYLVLGSRRSKQTFVHLRCWQDRRRRHVELYPAVI